MDQVLDALVSSLSSMTSLAHLGMLLLGVAIGLVVGFLPGLGGTAGLAMLLPFAYGMDPGLALAMMIGLLAPLNTSDTIPAILMGIPGSAGGQTTVMDGFPLAKRGEASRALSAAFMASMAGGLIGAAILTIAVFAAKPLILMMGFGELMMLGLFSLTMVGVVAGDSAIKGLGACGIGLLLGCIGAAPATGEYRVTFDTLYLSEGIPLLIIALGLFAVPEIVDLLRKDDSIAENGTLSTSGWFDGMRDVLRNKWLVLRSSMMGAAIGALPGLGGSVADWIVYGQAVQSAKDKSQFGKGDIRGVIAPESANNAVTGGALIPTLLFGIPGSGSMAVLLGGFILIGLQPGPSMVRENLDLTFLIIWSLALGNLLAAGACFALSKPIATLTVVNYGLIGPVMLAILFFAAYQSTQSWHDFTALIVVGIFGICLKRFGWSRPAMLIGYVLSPMIEASVFRAAQIYGWSFLQRPIVIGLIVLTVLSLWAALRMKRAQEAEAKALAEAAGVTEAPAAMSLRLRLPQIGFTALMMGLAALVFVDAAGRSFMGRMFPFWCALATLALLALAMGIQIRARKATPVISDEEVEQPLEVGLLPLILWLLGYLALIAVLGVVLGSGVFIFAFTQTAVGKPMWRNLALGAVSALVLWFAGTTLGLHYPEAMIPGLP